MPSLDERLRNLINKRMPSRRKKPRKHRKTKDERDVDVTRLHELSETELVLIAQRAGYETASRQTPRDELIDLILGSTEPPEDALGPIREKIHRFVQSIDIMASTMPCDLDCPNCTHHWVVECYTDNRDLVE